MDLRDARNHFGLKQQEFADIIGVSASSISLWENGLTSPRSTSLDRIDRAIEILQSQCNSEEPTSSYEWKALTLGLVILSIILYLK